MPQISSINVPDDLWEELVRCQAYGIAQEAIATIAHTYLVIDTTGKLKQLNQWFKPDVGFNAAQFAAEQRLRELVQNEMSDDRRAGEALSDADRAFDNVISAVTDFTDQVAFDALFDVANLKLVIEQKLKAPKNQTLSSSQL